MSFRGHVQALSDNPFLVSNETVSHKDSLFADRWFAFVVYAPDLELIADTLAFEN
jgi:hypothetical protein